VYSRACDNHMLISMLHGILSLHKTYAVNKSLRHAAHSACTTCVCMHPVLLQVLCSDVPNSAPAADDGCACTMDPYTIPAMRGSELRECLSTEDVAESCPSKYPTAVMRQERSRGASQTRQHALTTTCLSMVGPPSGGKCASLSSRLVRCLAIQ
jgi:hypothetical protein